MTSMIGSRALGMALIAVLWTFAPAEAADEDAKVLVLAQPFARADAIWMAQSKEFFKAEGIAVSVRWMAGGADMLGVFGQGRDGRQGFGDFIVLSELSAVNFWQSVHPDFVVIAALARDAQGYVGIAKAGINDAQALGTKPVATRLGSTSAWLLGEYLRAHGMSEQDVALKNESPEAILTWDPGAADGAAAFFVREPYGARALAKHGDRVHLLTTARGYGHGYLLLGTWKRYLEGHPGEVALPRTQQQIAVAVAAGGRQQVHAVAVLRQGAGAIGLADEEGSRPVGSTRIPGQNRLGAFVLQLDVSLAHAMGAQVFAEQPCARRSQSGRHRLRPESVRIVDPGLGDTHITLRVSRERRDHHEVRVDALPETHRRHFTDDDKVAEASAAVPALSEDAKHVGAPCHPPHRDGEALRFEEFLGLGHPEGISSGEGLSEHEHLAILISRLGRRRAPEQGDESDTERAATDRRGHRATSRP